MFLETVVRTLFFSKNKVYLRKSMLKINAETGKVLRYDRKIQKAELGGRGERQKKYQNYHGTCSYFK